MKSHHTAKSISSAEATSLSLLELIRSHDADAWRCMTELYGPLIYHWCRKSGLTAEDSADILQDVFGSIFTHIASFERTVESGTFRGWLWSITRNKIRDHFKVRSGKAKAVGGTDAHLRLLDIPDAEPSDDADSAISATDSLTYRALKLIRIEVKETTWLAFWRSTIDNIAPTAVAEEMGVSVESVWQAKSRVLRRLREMLA